MIAELHHGTENGIRPNTELAVDPTGYRMSVDLGGKLRGREARRFCRCLSIPPEYGNLRGEVMPLFSVADTPAPRLSAGFGEFGISVFLGGGAPR